MGGGGGGVRVERSDGGGGNEGGVLYRREGNRGKLHREGLKYLESDMEERVTVLESDRVERGKVQSTTEKRGKFFVSDIEEFWSPMRKRKGKWEVQ